MMNGSKGNINSKSFSQEQFDEHIEYEEQRVCLANECIFTRWTKPNKVRRLTFVSKDVLLIHVGKTLIFHNIKTKKEDFIIVGGNQSTPAGGNCLPLDGIGCIDSCGIDLLALAEHRPSAKIIICRYSDLKVLVSLIDSSCSVAYKSILFLRLDYLLGLRGYSAFDLIIWAWRTQEKLLTINTGFIQPNQYLSASATGRDVYLSLMERDVVCKLQLWTVLISSKTIYAEKTMVEFSDDADFQSGCWTHSGWFVYCDISGKVYRTQPNTPSPELCFEYAANSDKLCTLTCPTKQGFMIYSINDLSCFKDSKGVFTKIWSIVIKCTLMSIVANENDVYGWSDEGSLLELTQKKEQVLQVYGMNIKYFVFIKPTDEMVATINVKNVLQVWDVSTGAFKNEMILNGFVTHLCSNPLYYYIVVSFKDGKIELLKTNPKANDLEHVTKIILCDDEISSVNFCSNGEDCLVVSYPTGRFYFVSIKLGKMCSVIREFHLKEQVIDVELIDKKTSSLLSVLYKNERTSYVAGNNIIIFDTNFNTVLQLINTEYYYTSIFKLSSFDQPNVISIACVVLLTRYIHRMVINVNQAKVLESKTISLNHNIRSIQVSTYKEHCISFSYDGTYNLYEFDDYGNWKKIVTVNCSHWQTGGLVAAKTDGSARNILTLSYQGNFMCTSFKKSCNHMKQYHQIDASKVIDNIKTEGIGFENEIGTPKRMTWTMINKENEFNANKIAYSQQKNQIIQEFEEIKTELLKLLEKNTKGPEDQKISIEEFDLNVEHRMLFRKKSKTERFEYEAQILNEIKNLNAETRVILKEHWDSLFVKPKSINCIEKLYKVNNYSISIKEQEIIEEANRIIKKRNINKKDEDSAFSKIHLETFDESIFSEFDESSYKKSLMGSISHRFINSIEHMNSQYNYYKLDMVKDEIILLKHTVNRLKHSFNELFDNMFNEKQRQLDNLRKFNDRLRVIETEFKLACKIEPVEPLPEDYEWNQYERTEKLICVEDYEVPIKPYNSIIFSNEQMSIDANLGKKEQNKQLLVVDNFRQRALIDMMDGVLEKRWEDELKKDVPKPQCMLNKKPEDYTEDDLKDISNFEKAVVVWNDERMKYKKILEEEKTKIKQNIRESVENFDSSLFNLFKMKLKYNSAVNQELMKMIRLSKMLSGSEQRKQQIHLHSETKSEIENAVIETNKKIAETKATNDTLLNTIGTLKYKKKVLDKRFKAEFPSRLIYEQALIAYNRRPKIHGNTNYSLLLGYQFVNTIMDPNDDKLDILCSELVQYLDTLKTFDDYKYVEDYKLNMDRETWHKVCNFRRMKIESEFKISTCQRDEIDKANLLASLERDKKDKEDIIETLKLSIVTLKNQESHYEDDPEIQLVVKQGNTEIELTGHFDSFNNTMLIAKHVVEEVNAEIKKTGKIKIDVLTNLLSFKRKCRLLKWEHEILKNHKINLYKNRFDVIKLMKITDNMLHYLKYKAKGINISKQAEQKVEKELAGMKTTYGKEKRELERLLDELMKKIEKVKKENKKADKKIDEMTLNLSHLKSEIDPSLTNKLKLVSDLRMKNIMKRTQMVTNIQELHREIILLHTELELLLLKTFPTLYNTPKSVRK